MAGDAAACHQHEAEFERKCCKLITGRLILRAIMLVIIGILIYFLPIVEWTLHYCDYISTFPLWKQILFFTLFATAFHTIMPTGYLPTVLSGLVFADYFFFGWAVSYVSVNLGSMLNMIWVRAFNLKVVRRFLRKKIDAFAFLNKMLALRPFRTVLLFRLPYLYVGTVNYIMAFSDIDFKTYILANALGYISGSGLFTALGRSGRNLLEMISKSDQLSTGEIFIEAAILVTILVCTIAAVIYAKSIVKQERLSFGCKHDLQKREVKKYGERCHVCYRLLIADSTMNICSKCGMKRCADCEMEKKRAKRDISTTHTIRPLYTFDAVRLILCATNRNGSWTRRIRRKSLASIAYHHAKS